MKTIKISIFIIAIAAIGFFIYQSYPCCDLPESLRFNQECYDCEEPEKADDSENAYFNKLRNEIKLLETDSKTGFQKNAYLVLQNLIDSDREADRIDNQEEQVLKEELLRTYAQGFNDYSFGIFNGNEWNPQDLNHIKNESDALLNNPMIKSGSLRNDVEDVAAVMESYHKAYALIARANSFYPSISLNHSFNDNDKASTIKGIAAGFSHDKYLKNCDRLVNGLNEIPVILYGKHFNYLQRKIDVIAPTYKDYGSQPLYSRCIYEPLKSEINDFYTSNGFSDTYDKYKILESQLSHFNTEAFIYFKNTPDAYANARYKSSCP